MSSTNTNLTDLRVFHRASGKLPMFTRLVNSHIRRASRLHDISCTFQQKTVFSVEGCLSEKILNGINLQAMVQFEMHRWHGRFRSCHADKCGECAENCNSRL